MHGAGQYIINNPNWSKKGCQVDVILYVLISYLLKIYSEVRWLAIMMDRHYASLNLLCAKEHNLLLKDLRASFQGNCSGGPGWKTISNCPRARILWKTCLLHGGNETKLLAILISMWRTLMILSKLDCRYVLLSSEKVVVIIHNNLVLNRKPTSR